MCAFKAGNIVTLFCGQGFARRTTQANGVVLIFIDSLRVTFSLCLPLGPWVPASLLCHFFSTISSRFARSEQLSRDTPFGWMEFVLTFTPWIGPGEIGLFFRRPNCSVTGGDNAMVYVRLNEETSFLFWCIPIRNG